MIFNDGQQKAIAQIDGIVNINSGAGTGKTTIVTYRIANMIKQGIDSKNILALTYTNAASNEMKGRITTICGKDIETHISTFHVFAKKILDEYDPINQNLLWANDDFCKWVLSVITGERDDDILIDLYDCITKLQNHTLTKEDVKDEVIKYHEELESFLNKMQRISFGTALTKLNRMLDNKKILKEVQEQYKYIIVDEFQDVNSLQFEIIRKITGENGNLCVVGDVKQSIYGFNGGNVEFISEFEKYYPNAHYIAVNENYRSTKNILDSANMLMDNSDVDNVYLTTSKKDGEHISFVCDRTQEQNYSTIADTILKRTNDNMEFFKHCIIARTNYELKKVKKILDNKGIPNRIYRDSILSVSGVEHILLHLKLFDNKISNYEFRDLLNRYYSLFNHISKEELNYKMNILKQDKISILKSIHNGYGILADRIIDFRQKYKSLNETNMLNIVDDVITTIDVINYDANKGTTYKTKPLKSDKDVGVFFKILTAFSKTRYKYNDSNDFIKCIMSFIGENRQSDNEVQLLTGHKAKGLEFEYVYVVSVTDDVFPMIKENTNIFYSDRYIQKNSDNFIHNINRQIQEERRLFYVVVTRAKEHLTIYLPVIKRIDGALTTARPSRFLKEMFNNELPEQLKKAYKLYEMYI